MQDQMAADLRQAPAGLDARSGAVLAGMHASTDQSRCDVENRLFTNLGPASLAGIRFERGVGVPPPAPVPVARAHGHLYYYRYQLTAPGNRGSLLARWYRVTSLAWPDKSPTTRAAPGGGPEGTCPPPGNWLLQ